LSLTLPADAPSAAERIFSDAVERAARQPAGRLALALHLSRLRYPGPRPYHLRVARALMEGAAQRVGGQVFAMRNGDMVLLGTSGAGGQPHLAELTGALERLYEPEGLGQPALTTFWRLPDQLAALRDYAASRAAAHADAEAVAHEQDAGSEATGPPRVTAASFDLDRARAHFPSLMMQQTAIMVRPEQPGGAGARQSLGGRLAPLYRDVILSPEALATLPGLGEAMADPYLRRHLTQALEPLVIGWLARELACDGRLIRPARLLSIALHVRLGPASILSASFAQLAAEAARAGIRLGVEVTPMDFATDPALSQSAQQVLRLHGVDMVLGGLEAAALTLLDLSALAPALIKVNWSERVGQAGAGRAAVEAAVASIGPARIVLARADSEDALVWGQANGVTRYQGYFLDAVQAASRMAICHSAKCCSLRQCINRGVALAPELRAACGNPMLLDLGGTRPAAP
jgi:EAL domain-containing protein (putative c-di-GMP-specific phosphodiesterase class I)